MEKRALPVEDLIGLKDRKFASAQEFLRAIDEWTYLDGKQQKKILEYSEAADIFIAPDIVDTLLPDWMTAGQIAAVGKLSGRQFDFKWAVADALEQLSDEWKMLPNTIENKRHNKEIKAKLSFVYRQFSRLN